MIVLSFARAWLGCVRYIAAVITWLIRDSRIEKKLRDKLRPTKQKDKQGYRKE
ncbi:MAG: hypothetical protein ACR2JB_06100 [Bryobacteraceae bacterium]